jgi:N utilization substance protein B
MNEPALPWNRDALMPATGAHGERRSSRGVALQALYEIDLAHHDPETVLTNLQAAQPVTPAAARNARRLVEGVLAHQQAIDSIIRETAPAWPVDQMAIIDKNILRLAIFEVLFDNEVPDKVAINEAIELAKVFGSDASARFVNGVLGTVAARKDRAGQHEQP